MRGDARAVQEDTPMPIATINPTTGVTERTFEAHTAAEVEAIIAAAHAANAVMVRSTFAERSAWMHRAADILESELEEVARLASTEMGKTIGTARFEVSKSARGMRFYADHAEAFLADEHPVPAAEVGASVATVR